MTIRNKPNGLCDIWGARACPPQSVFYELEGPCADIAKRSLEGEHIRILDAKSVNLVEPQTLVFLGEQFKAVAYYATLYRLTVSQGTERFFASVPVGYNRDFTPLLHGREIIDDNEYAHIMMGLFANGHSTPAQLDVKEPEDRELPSDFYPETSLFHLAIYDMRL